MDLRATGSGGEVLSSQAMGVLFEDVHNQLDHLCADLERTRKEIARNDEHLRQEIEQIDAELEDEVHDRRDGFDKLHNEFEAFTYHKVERVVQELESCTKEHEIRAGARMRQLLDTVREMDLLKLHLTNISACWAPFDQEGTFDRRLHRQLLFMRERRVTQFASSAGSPRPIQSQ
mmetsp:Transcript_110833/g.220439  ORF Transcript_110833/g.220439 Transcript_110833/m.220439 type:complete len:175 (+) Transcript_110833:101-625(+)